MEGQLCIVNIVVNLFLMVPGFVAFVVKIRKQPIISIQKAIFLFRALSIQLYPFWFRLQ